MKILKCLLIAALAILLLSSTLYSRDFKGRWRIELKAGYWGQTSNDYTTVTPSGINVDVPGNSILSGLALSHWVSDDLAFVISTGYAAASIETHVSILEVNTHYVSIIPLLLGARYYLDFFSDESHYNPYLAASVGTFVASEVGTQVGTTVVSVARNLSTFGGHVGAGLDMDIGKNLIFGVSTGYNFMRDYSERIGSRDNYSGPEFAFSISYIFGRGK